MPGRNYKVINDRYQEVTDRIVAALEQGVAPWVCPWRRGAEGGRPRNGASGHVYRGINIVLTGMAGYSSSRWYTFRQAKQLGGMVRRGERGTMVICWRFIEASAAHDEGAADDAEKTRKIPLLRHYIVFNAEQIAWPEGSQHALQLDPGPTGDVVADAAAHPAADALIEATGADLRHGGTRALYATADDYICVPERDRFENAAAYHATVLHELAHWTGHGSRLARDLSGRFGSEAYAAEELVAELAAAFLCAELGIAGQLQHAEYIGSWIKVLRQDKRAVFTASRLAQEAADYLTGSVTCPEAWNGAQTASEALGEAA